MARTAGTAIRRESLLLSTPYEAPDGGLELLITKLFAEVFNVDKVGANDDFFDIGGDSLVAETLSLAISEHIGRDFQLSALIEHGSPRKIATLLEVKSTEAAALVSVGGHNRPPIFMVHGRDGLTFPTADFRRALADGQKLHMFELPGIRGGHSYDQIEDIAVAYVAQLVENYREGPIFLASFCMGALIALEMAAQLAKKGRTVAQLVLLDPGTPKWLVAVKPGVASQSTPRQLPRGWLRRSIWRLLPLGLGARKERPPKETMADKYRRKLGQQAREGRMTKHPGLRISIDARAKLRAAYKQYRPVPFHGRVAILASRNRESIFRDPSLIWNELLPLRQTHVVTEHHSGIAGASTARHMQSIFDAALAETELPDCRSGLSPGF